LSKQPATNGRIDKEIAFLCKNRPSESLKNEIILHERRQILRKAGNPIVFHRFCA